MARRKAINYVSNGQLLKEIHKSKTSFCQYDDKTYADYDIIVHNLDALSDEKVEQAKQNRCKRFNTLVGDDLFAKDYTNKQINEHLLQHGKKSTDFSKEDIIVRLMQKDHIPKAKNKKGIVDHIVVNFPAFQHYKWIDNAWVSVGKSHFKDNEFNQEFGKISNNLAKAFLLLVERYGSKGNWRNYTWLDEMKSHSLVRLSQVGLSFDESKSDNPFAYFTAIMSNSFTQVLNKEKEHIKTRNQLIVEMGYDTNFNNQADHDIETYYRDNPMKVEE